MAAVAAVAITEVALIEVGNSWARHSRYSSALRAYCTHKADYEEGRATMGQCVERSRRLMEAEIALCWTKEARVAAIEAHLARTSSLIDEEINWPWSLHDTGYERAPEIAAAKGSLREWRARLSNLIRAR